MPIENSIKVQVNMATSIEIAYVQNTEDAGYFVFSCFVKNQLYRVDLSIKNLLQLVLKLAKK